MNRLSLASRPAASFLLARSQGCANMMALRRFSEDINPSRLFVGGLSWSTDENKLRDAFQPYGEVTHVRVVVDRESGRSRGFGFVTYDSAEEAQKAAQSMHEQEIDGRRVSVSFARNPTNRSQNNFRQRENKEESYN